MTEVEWMACDETVEMLQFLTRTKASSRKIRLFAVACCRRIWHQLTDERSRKAVEVAERLAEGQVPSEEFDRAWKQSNQATPTFKGSRTTLRDSPPGYFAASTARQTLTTTAMGDSAYFAVAAVEKVVFEMTGDEMAKEVRAASEEETQQQTILLRDIFGPLPFRPVTIAPAWRTSAVVSLAQTLYDQRQFDRMPILGDALEDAGCTSPEILNHCRQPGDHVRGCWVVDLILEKG